jgi:hypothetical protein
MKQKGVSHEQSLQRQGNTSKKTVKFETLKWFPEFVPELGILLKANKSFELCILFSSSIH